MESKKIRFNIIDILIILVLVCIVAVFSYFAAGKWETGKSENTDTKVAYTVEIQSVDEKFINKITVDDEVWDVRKGGALGIVTAVEEAKIHKSIVENKDAGTYVASEVPGKYTYKFTVTSPCSAAETGYSINDTKIAVGKKIAMRTENIAVEGTILNVELISE